MPYSKAHKAQTRARILTEAAHAFREEGIEGVGIPAVMERAGLTHGGFYAHFPTKDALVAEACAEGFAEAEERLLRRAAATEPEDAMRAIITGYLSRKHRDDPATGCMIPALATEIARAPQETRAAFTQALTGYARQLSAYFPAASDTHESVAPTNDANGAHDANGAEYAANAADAEIDANLAAQREDDALVLLAGMAGALLLARAVDDPDVSHRILKAARTFYLQAFDKPTAPAATAS
ncbi:MAG TPA: TetR/AcrR family transcriptional regulator [Ktedonobacterales bacterium]|nr:TetR/AcrR family transcriptional regulator [Ktedonobacterales bacterium]